MFEKSTEGFGAIRRELELYGAKLGVFGQNNQEQKKIQALDLGKKDRTLACRDQTLWRKSGPTLRTLSMWGLGIGPSMADRSVSGVLGLCVRGPVHGAQTSPPMGKMPSKGFFGHFK